MHPHFSPLTHLDFAGDSTVDEGGFILLELGDLLLLEGDGGVDFGGFGFNEVDYGGLFGERWYCYGISTNSVDI